MANVQLPSIDTAETDIKALVQQLLNAYAILTKELLFILNNLDTRNVNELNAEVIIAGSIVAGKLAADSVEALNIIAGAIQTDKLAAGAVTAEKITVEELSAITANLGHITAGLIESVEIYGSYIATRRNAFPRAEISNVGDLLAVYTDALNSMTVEPGITDEPTLTFRKGGSPSLILGPAFGLTALLASVNLLVGTQSGSLTLSCGSGVLDRVTVPDWNRFASAAIGETLADALAGKATAGASTGSAGGANAGIPIGTKLLVDGGGYVVWNGVPSHSHLQN